MIVGLTGGIGSGKTTVLNIFKSLGIAVYQADVEAKAIMHSSLEVKAKIVNLLGHKAYQNNKINKKYVASKVFHNKALLAKLNAIVHPAVRKDFADFSKKQQSPYLVYENAILFENKSEKMCDKIIVVTAPLKDRIERVMKRDTVDKQAVLARMEHQWSQEKKISKADYIINNHHLETLQKQVTDVHQQIIKDI